MSKKYMENYLQAYQKYIPETKVKDNIKKTENSVTDNNRKTTENSLEGSSNKEINSNNLNDANSFKNTDIINKLSNDPKLLENFIMFQKFIKIQNKETDIKSDNNIVLDNSLEKVENEGIRMENKEDVVEDNNIEQSNFIPETIIESNENKNEVNSNCYEERPIFNKNKNFVDLLEEKMKEEDYLPSDSQVVNNNHKSHQEKVLSQNLKEKKSSKINADYLLKNKVKPIDNKLNAPMIIENEIEGSKVCSIDDDVKLRLNQVNSKVNITNDKLLIQPAQIIQSKTKQLSCHSIPVKSILEERKNINDKLKIEVNKMKEELIDNDQSLDKEDLVQENSVNSDDRNLSEILGQEPKTIAKINTTSQQQGQMINNFKENNVPIGNSNSNNILKKYFGIQTKSSNNVRKVNDFDETTVDQKQAERERFTMIVNEKMKEINNEISKIKNENEKVAKLKGDFERNSKKLSKDIDDYNFEKENQVKEFEKSLEEERAKFQKEKKLHEKNIRAIINMPNKKEREEIEVLRSQLQKLNEDNKKKDQSYKLTIDRLKKQLEEAQTKISDMSKEVKFMEELKSKNWDKNSKNQPRTSNNIPSTSISSVAINDWGLAVHSNSGKIDQKAMNGKNLKRNESGANIVKCSKDEDEKKQEMNNKKIIETKIKSNEENNTKKQINENKNKIFSQKQEDSPKKMKLDNKNINDNNIKVDNRIGLNENVKSENNIKITLNENKVNQKEEMIYNDMNEKEIEEEGESEDLTQYDLTYPEKYHGKNTRIVKLLRQEISNDGKILKFYENNKKEVIFQSGVKKEIHDDGYTIVWFTNNDIKQTFPNGKIVYFFSDTNTVQNTFTDGLQVFKFEDGQIEKHYTDGAKEIIFPDKTIKYILPDGYEETMLPDGTLHKLDKNGIITIDHSNGDRENIYPDGIKVKEQTDGKVLKIYPDGKIEILKNSI